MTVSHVSDVTLLRRRYQLLPDGILPRVEEHLAGCDACRNRSEKLDQSWKIFDEWSVPSLTEAQQKQELEAVAKRPMRRPMAPPPRPRGDERAANQASERKGEDTRSSPSERRSPIPKYIAWGMLLLAAVLLGVSAALWAYLRSQRVDASLILTGPEEIEPKTPIGVRAQFTDAAGDPVKGARVSVQLRGEGIDEKKDETKTDERGEAVLRFEVPKAGEYTATVEAKGEFEQRAILLISARARHQILLSLFGAPASLGGEISARATVVTSGGQPLANAPILFEVFEPSGTRVARVERRSDSQGSAGVSLPIDRWARPGLWTLSATAGAAHTESNFDIPELTPKRFKIEASAQLDANNNTTLSAHVQDSFGMPVVGALSVGDKTHPIVDGFAQLQLQSTGDTIDLTITADGAEQKERIQVERSLNVSFVPENGAFHKALQPRGIIRVKRKEFKPTQVKIFLGEEEVGLADIDPQGYAVVDLPSKVLGRELTIKADGAEVRVNPPVKEGPAVQCDRALTVVGKPISCTVYHPKQSLLFVSQRGRLLTAIPLPPSQKVQPIEIPTPAAGILEIGFGGADDLYAFVYAATPSGLSISGAANVAANDKYTPVDLVVRDGAGAGVAANVSVGLLLEEPAARLPTTHEPEAKYLLSGYGGVPARVQNISTIAEEGPRVNELRRAYGARLRWVVTVTVVFFSVGVGLWVWFVDAAFFYLFLPAFFGAFALGVVVQLWLIPLVFLLWVALFFVRKPQARPALGLWVAALSMLLGVWLSASLWKTPLPSIAVPPPDIPQPRAVPASPLPQVIELSEPFSPLTTNPEGKVSWDAPRATKGSQLHLYAEATAQNGSGASVLSLPTAASVFSVALLAPSRMVQGDQVSVPVFARSLNNSDADTLSVSFSGEAGLTVRGGAPGWQRSKGPLAAVAQVIATAAGVSKFSLQGADLTSKSPTILQESSISIAPKVTPVSKSQWGQVDALVELPLPPKTSGAGLWLFRDEFAAAQWKLEHLSSPLSCTVEHAARLELLALLLQKQNTEELQRTQRQSLEAIAAAEVEGGGFSICGGERFDLYTTAVTMIALRDIAEVSAIDPSLVARAREALAQNVSQSKPQPAEAAFYTWALQIAGGADDPNVQKTIDMLLQLLPEEPSVPAYGLGVATVALQRGARAEKAQTYQQKLAGMLGTSFSLLSASQPSISGAVGIDADIEASYFTALSFPKGSPERQQLLVALGNSMVQSDLLFSWVLRLLASEATEAQDITASVSGLDAPVKLISEEPAKFIPLNFVGRAASAIQIKADGKFLYSIEFESAPAELNPTLQLKWPEQLTQGQSFSVELGAMVSSESVLSLPLPAAVEPDLVAMSALQESGAVGRFLVQDGVLWVSLPPVTSPLQLPMRAARAGVVSVPSAVLSSINAPNKQEQSAPGRLEVRP